MKTTVVDWTKVSLDLGTWVRDNAVREAEIVMLLRHPNIVTTYTYSIPSQGKPDPTAPDPAAAAAATPPWQLNLVQASGRLLSTHPSGFSSAVFCFLKRLQRPAECQAECAKPNHRKTWLKINPLFLDEEGGIVTVMI